MKSRAHNRTERKQLAPARSPHQDIEFARVQLSTAEMNRLEMRFSVDLDLRRKAGELTWWAYEPLSFRIGRGAHYRPDFVALDCEGLLTAYEVKGRWEEAARVRIKVAAALYPWLRFVAVKSARGRSRERPARDSLSEWIWEELRP